MRIRLSGTYAPEIFQGYTINVKSKTKGKIQGVPVEGLTLETWGLQRGLYGLNGYISRANNVEYGTFTTNSFIPDEEETLRARKAIQKIVPRVILSERGFLEKNIKDGILVYEPIQQLRRIKDTDYLVGDHSAWRFIQEFRDLDFSGKDLLKVIQKKKLIWFSRKPNEPQSSRMQGENRMVIQYGSQLKLYRLCDLMSIDL